MSEVKFTEDEMKKLADAEDKLKSLNSNFKDSLQNPKLLKEQGELGLSDVDGY